MKVALFGPWIGEFGWELMTWQAWCRAKSREFDKSYVCSFPDMAPLYTDFATFIPHDHEGRALDWQKEANYSKAHFELPDDITDKFIPPKDYRHTMGEWIRFGGEEKEPGTFDYVIHARGIKRGGKDYPIDQWEKLVAALDNKNIASVGTLQDHHIKGTHDFRGINLETLMWYLSNAGCVIGQSSGVMHLSSLCCAPHVVWGDMRTQFGGEKLGERYGKTWNPFNTPNCFIYDDDWKPDHVEVVKQAIEMFKTHRKPNTSEPKLIVNVKDKPAPVSVKLPKDLRDRITEAVNTGKYLITVTSQNGTKLEHFCSLHDFEQDNIIPSMEKITETLKHDYIDSADQPTQPAKPEQTGVENWR
jgi:hypothetical protein